MPKNNKPKKVIKKLSAVIFSTVLIFSAVTASGCEDVLSYILDGTEITGSTSQSSSYSTSESNSSQHTTGSISSDDAATDSSIAESTSSSSTPDSSSADSSSADSSSVDISQSDSSSADSSSADSISTDSSSADSGSDSTSSESTSTDSTSQDSSADSSDTEVAEDAQEDIVSANLSIHFLELGNKYAGDCTLIKCGDTEVLIDAGSRQGSATTLCNYINEYCTDGVLEYVIATHSDQDHIAGFYGNSSGSTRTGVLYQYGIKTLIMYDQSNSTSQIAGNFESRVQILAENGVAVYTASQCYDQTDGAQRQYYLDEEQTISINILYNYYYYNASSDNNNHSVVTLLTQETEEGALNYLFTGDLEEDGESRMVDYYADIPQEYATEYNVLPEVELYKAGHHGSKTSSTEKLLSVIKPKNVAVCCCCGSPEYTTNNDNTFPTQTMITNVSKYTENVYVTTLAVIEDFENKKYDYTSMNGNIVFYYSAADGEEGASLKLWCSNNTTKLKDTDWFADNRTWG